MTQPIESFRGLESEEEPSSRAPERDMAPRAFVERLAQLPLDAQCAVLSEGVRQVFAQLDDEEREALLERWSH